MAYLEVDLDKISRISEDYAYIKKQLSYIQSEFKSCVKQLDWEVTSREYIDIRAAELCKTMDFHINAIDAIANFLNSVKEGYMELEGNIGQWNLNIGEGKSDKTGKGASQDSGISRNDNIISNLNSYIELIKYLMLIGNNITNPLNGLWKNYIINNMDQVISGVDKGISVLNFLKNADQRAMQLYPYMKEIPETKMIKNFREATKWFDLVETIHDTVSTGYKKYKDYNADGEFSLEDLSLTLMESSISGLVNLTEVAITKVTDYLPIGASEAVGEFFDRANIPENLTSIITDNAKKLTDQAVRWWMKTF